MDEEQNVRPVVRLEPLIGPSYHDLHITTSEIPRTSIFNLPFELMVTCTRVGGWELWRRPNSPAEKLLAGEYDACGLRLDVSGHVIVDSLPPNAQVQPPSAPGANHD